MAEARLVLETTCRHGQTTSHVITEDWGERGRVVVDECKQGSSRVMTPGDPIFTNAVATAVTDIFAEAHPDIHVRLSVRYAIADAALRSLLLLDEKCATCGGRGEIVHVVDGNNLDHTKECPDCTATATTIWWCEQHNVSGNSILCWAAHPVLNPDDESCRMVAKAVVG